MNVRKICVAIVGALLIANVAYGQFGSPGPEHELLKEDVGTWKATTKMWMDPAGEPSVSEAMEVNTMMGDYWLVSDFKGDFGGMAFVGRSTTGYDPMKKKFVGNWIDTTSPYETRMEGTYDKSTKTMTFSTTGVGMDGKESKGKIISKTLDDGSRLMTMFNTVEGKDVKIMEVVYTKVKK